MGDIINGATVQRYKGTTAIEVRRRRTEPPNGGELGEAKSRKAGDEVPR